ncbi:MAG: PhzF family phenazine biosynthesis protein [Desulfobacteraceae bacterium]|nr:PhzF family phenazine biosynthesis protein [Desulfobacteraceae bacterium]
MELDIFQIDAFTQNIFSGNPAAVCPLENWLEDDIMQSIALENNLSETAFFIPNDNGYHIRWFTPVTEVDLCGHATLASAFVLFNILGYAKNKIHFDSKSGPLVIHHENDRMIMDFPSQPPVPCDIPLQLEKAFHIKPVECLISEDYLVIFKNEQEVLELNPDMDCLKKLNLRGVSVTAKGSGEYDFINRFFAPKYGVPEDPVTGSAFTQLVPYWSKKLGKKTLKARQVSSRGGDVQCCFKSDRVKISGQAALYLKGKIHI